MLREVDSVERVFTNAPVIDIIDRFSSQHTSSNGLVFGCHISELPLSETGTLTIPDQDRLFPV